jgi:hypothetical protein
VKKKKRRPRPRLTSERILNKLDDLLFARRKKRRRRKQR